MFQFTNKPSSGSHSQYLAKITGLVQCRYRRRTDVSAMVAVLCALAHMPHYTAIALRTSEQRLYLH